MRKGRIGISWMVTECCKWERNGRIGMLYLGVARLETAGRDGYGSEGHGLFRNVAEWQEWMVEALSGEERCGKEWQERKVGDSSGQDCRGMDGQARF